MLANFNHVYFKIDLNLSKVKKYVWQHRRLSIREVVAIQTGIVFFLLIQYNEHREETIEHSKQRRRLCFNVKLPLHQVFYRRLPYIQQAFFRLGRNSITNLLSTYLADIAAGSSSNSLGSRAISTPSPVPA